MMFINMDNYFRKHEGVGKFDVIRQAGERVAELIDANDETLPLQTARGKKITTQVLNEILSDEIVASIVDTKEKN